jgi:hypothetical protein
MSLFVFVFCFFLLLLFSFFLPPSFNNNQSLFHNAYFSLQEIFLEELTDRPIEKAAETQTESFLDRPPSPLFVPAKSGLDKDTQIEAGDLFDFDLEVTPILDVLCGKTLEVSMLELLEEEEISAIRKRQEEFEMMRNSELTEVQRLEYEARERVQG